MIKILAFLLLSHFIFVGLTFALLDYYANSNIPLSISLITFSAFASDILFLGFVLKGIKITQIQIFQFIFHVSLVVAQLLLSLSVLSEKPALTIMMATFVAYSFVLIKNHPTLSSAGFLR